MHWQIASAVRDVNAMDNSAFSYNACLSQSGASTQVLKKVTCKSCKPLITQPRSPEQVAALLYYRAVSETDNEHWVTFECNGCECQGVDSQEFTYEPQWVSIGRLIVLLGHAAHDHSMGTEVVLSRHETPLSVYELNFALGVDARTSHEEQWRERASVLDAEPQKV